MKRDLEVRRGVVIPAEELVESASRSSGPGGQHVNKASTRVTLRWRPQGSAALSPAQQARVCARLEARLTRAGELIVHAQRHRSRSRNRELARERLAELVRDALATRASRVPTRPGRAARQRALDEKRRRGRVKRMREPVRGED